MISDLNHRASNQTGQRDWNGMAMFANDHVRENDPRMEAVYANYRRNLEKICEIADRTGANLLMCTVATNLRNSPPFGSLMDEGTSSHSTPEWNRLVKEGIVCENKGEIREAVSFYQEAAEIDGSYAELQYRLARVLISSGKVAEATRHFIRARDCDTLRFRADTRINQLIRDVAADHTSDSVQLADTDAGCGRQRPWDPRK